GHTSRPGGIRYEADAIVTIANEHLAWARSDGRPLGERRPEANLALRARIEEAAPALHSRLAGTGTSANVLPGGDTVLAWVGGHAYEVWDLERGVRKATFVTPRNSYHWRTSPDGKLFAVSSIRGQITVYCLETGVVLEAFDSTTRCQTSRLAWSS